MFLEHQQTRTDRIIEAARSFLGAAFHHQGRHSTRMDCIGLLVLSFRKAGFPLKDYTAYSRQPDPDTLLTHMNASFVQVTEREPQAGDVLLFAFRKKGPQHAALLTGEGTLIHTWANVGKVVENDNYRQRWKRVLHSHWEYRWQQ